MLGAFPAGMRLDGACFTLATDAFVGLFSVVAAVNDGRAAAEAKSKCRWQVFSNLDANRSSLRKELELPEGSEAEDRLRRIDRFQSLRRSPKHRRASRS